MQASIDGSSDQTLLVDTGSSGLVIPWEDLGLLQTLELGLPTGIGEGGYSGGVDYIYLDLRHVGRLPSQRRRHP